MDIKDNKYSRDMVYSSRDMVKDSRDMMCKNRDMVEHKDEINQEGQKREPYGKVVSRGK